MMPLETPGPPVSDSSVDPAAPKREAGAEP